MDGWMISQKPVRTLKNNAKKNISEKEEENNNIIIRHMNEDVHIKRESGGMN